MSHQIIRCGAIRRVVDNAVEELSPTFSEVHSTRGRPSIPPERLLRALVLYQRPMSATLERVFSLESFRDSIYGPPPVCKTENP